MTFGGESSWGRGDHKRCRTILLGVVAAYVCLPWNYSFYGFLFYRVLVFVGS